VRNRLFGSATPCASHPPWPSIFSGYSFLVHHPVNLGPIFRTFFPWKIFPQKMLGKIAIFRGKSFEKSFFQQIPRNFPQKITFRGKKCTKNWPQDDRHLLAHAMTPDFTCAWTLN
jgi:hypothetical protein